MLGRLGLGKDRQVRLIQLIETPQIVDPGHVIGVSVGEEHRVDVLDADPNGLRSAVRAKCRSGSILPSKRMTAEVRLRVDRADPPTCRPDTSQPIIGIPFEVPVPRKVISTINSQSSHLHHGKYTRRSGQPSNDGGPKTVLMGRLFSSTRRPVVRYHLN